MGEVGAALEAALRPTAQLGIELRHPHRSATLHHYHPETTRRKKGHGTYDQRPQLHDLRSQLHDLRSQLHDLGLLPLDAAAVLAALALPRLEMPEQLRVSPGLVFGAGEVGRGVGVGGGGHGCGMVGWLG